MFTLELVHGNYTNSRSMRFVSTLSVQSFGRLRPELIFLSGEKRFLQSGGFDERLDNNEHRELALRLCQTGGRMGFIAGARTYHLTHRSGWRNPLVETGWESVFYERHPITAVKLLAVLWASLSDKSPIPKHARITSLPELERAARGETNVDYDSIRRLIPGLPELLGHFRGRE